MLADTSETVLSARGLIKTFGRVVGLDGVDLDLYPGEVLAIIGDNGAGKSTLVKALTGALTPDSGRDLPGRPSGALPHPDGRPHRRHRNRLPDLGGRAGTGYRQQPVPRPGRAPFRPSWLDPPDARQEGHEGQGAGSPWPNLGVGTIQNMGQAVETLSGGQRQAVAVARAAAFATKFVVLDEPTAALGVKETGQVLNLIRKIKAKGMPIILISHNMPNVFEVADRIHIARLGGCAGIITPQSHTPTEAVAIMTGATTLQKG